LAADDGGARACCRSVYERVVAAWDGDRARLRVCIIERDARILELEAAVMSLEQQLAELTKAAGS
jgi:hypothetical protein